MKNKIKLSCSYTRTITNPYSDTWRGNCGSEVVCEAPIDVGFGFAPKPSFKFCPECGREVRLE